MSKQLPERPHLDHLREQAKDLLKSYRAGDAGALARLSAALPHLSAESVALHDAQSAVAREYGFASWRELAAEVETIRAREGITTEVVDRFVELALSDRVDALKRILELYPGLPRFSPVCWLVSGESELVREWLTPELIQEKLGPNEWLPLEYVCYSRMHRADPSRYEGLLECARLLLDAGTDVHTFHVWEGDPNAKLFVLYGAAGESGHVGIVRLLLERGAEPNDGESVYHAAQFNRREVLEALLEHGAEISGKDAHLEHQPDAHAWNNTPMFFLLGHRPSDPGMQEAAKGIEWLLAHGADPNVRCYEPEETALHAACRGGWSGEMVELLLRHGADPSLLRKDGRSAYSLAMMTGNSSAAEALERAGAAHKLEDKEAFLAACALGDRSRAREMLREHPDLIGRFDAHEQGVLVKLAEYGVVDGVKTMLEMGFNVGAMGEGCATALHFACFTGRADVVRVLLEHGAPLDVKDGMFSATPLGWALHAVRQHPSPSGDYVGVVRALLDAGAPVEEVREVLDTEEGVRLKGLRVEESMNR